MSTVEFDVCVGADVLDDFVVKNIVQKLQEGIDVVLALPNYHSAYICLERFRRAGIGACIVVGRSNLYCAKKVRALAGTVLDEETVALLASYHPFNSKDDIIEKVAALEDNMPLLQALKMTRCCKKYGCSNCGHNPFGGQFEVGDGNNGTLYITVHHMLLPTGTLHSIVDAVRPRAYCVVADFEGFLERLLLPIDGVSAVSVAETERTIASVAKVLEKWHPFKANGFAKHVGRFVESCRAFISTMKALADSGVEHVVLYPEEFPDAETAYAVRAAFADLLRMVDSVICAATHNGISDVSVVRLVTDALLTLRTVVENLLVANMCDLVHVSTADASLSGMYLPDRTHKLLGGFINAWARRRSSVEFLTPFVSEWQRRVISKLAAGRYRVNVHRRNSFGDASGVVFVTLDTPSALSCAGDSKQLQEGCENLHQNSSAQSEYARFIIDCTERMARILKTDCALIFSVSPLEAEELASEVLRRGHDCLNLSCSGHRNKTDLRSFYGVLEKLVCGCSGESDCRRERCKLSIVIADLSKWETLKLFAQLLAAGGKRLRAAVPLVITRMPLIPPMTPLSTQCRKGGRSDDYVCSVGKGAMRLCNALRCASTFAAHFVKKMGAVLICDPRVLQPHLFLSGNKSKRFALETAKAFAALGFSRLVPLAVSSKTLDALAGRNSGIPAVSKSDRSDDAGLLLENAFRALRCHAEELETADVVAVFGYRGWLARKAIAESFSTGLDCRDVAVLHDDELYRKMCLEFVKDAAAVLGGTCSEKMLSIATGVPERFVMQVLHGTHEENRLSCRCDSTCNFENTASVSCGTWKCLDEPETLKVLNMLCILLANASGSERVDPEESGLRSVDEGKCSICGTESVLYDVVSFYMKGSNNPGICPTATAPLCCRDCAGKLLGMRRVNQRGVSLVGGSVYSVGIYNFEGCVPLASPEDIALLMGMRECMIIALSPYPFVDSAFSGAGRVYPLTMLSGALSRPKDGVFAVNVFTSSRRLVPCPAVLPASFQQVIEDNWDNWLKLCRENGDVSLKLIRQFIDESGMLGTLEQLQETDPVLFAISKELVNRIVYTLLLNNKTCI